MKLDIRFPIGLLLCTLGLLLAVFGLLSDPSLYRRSLGINVNLWWGLVLAVAGALMLALSRMGSNIPAKTEKGANGRPAAEARETTGD